jgi:glycosyltransferase involved in cell wall biosynthesis
MGQLWLDVARLVERACIGTLTGIDRVELAYAETLAQLPAGQMRFVMLGRWSGRLRALPHGAVLDFLRKLRVAWRDGRPDACRGRAARLLAAAAGGRFVAAPVDGPPPVYLLVSHRHLHREAALAGALRRAGAVFVPLIHDVIPLAFPEYGRPGEETRHRRRMATVARLADGVVVNSVETGAALAPHLPADLRVHAAPLGVSMPSVGVMQEVMARPYFVCVGTIEPRKNHLLLLHVWRRLVALHGDLAPRLVIVGKRGWENENVLDLLDRCAALKGHVVELGAVSDVRLAGLLRGARALLMPSFAEGFGLPVAEALSQGTPVICSDLPAMREVGAGVPEYLDPLHAVAWQDAVQAYAGLASPRRAAQLGRMPGWCCTSWEAHVASVVGFARGLPRRRAIGAFDAGAVWSRPSFGEAVQPVAGRI